jgi:hypothetical protein
VIKEGKAMRKVRKPREYLDDKGYIVTEMVSDYEECDEAEVKEKV